MRGFRWVLPRRAAEWAAAVAGLMLALPAFTILAPLPPLEAYLASPGTVILDATGGVIERETAAGVRIPTTLDRIAPVVLDATVAAEDQRFWAHPGVDPFAAIRAAGQVRSNPSGASTITQQLARGTYLDGTRLPLPLRKAREVVVALALDAQASKDEVLEAYLNHVYYGRGAYGIEAAAQVYFGVSARQLDLAQASFLAGLPRAPLEYDQSAEAARDRQQYVLARMVATGSLTETQAEAAAATALQVVPSVPPVARHLAASVFEELRRALPEHAEDAGLVIETTLDPALQRQAEASVRTRLARLAEHDAGSAAVVVIDPRDGRLLALVGSADYDATAGQINMATVPRQPGSALKPLLYAAAIEHGYGPASMLLDVPTAFATESGPYRPANYDLRFRGPVTLRVALGSSLNVPAVRTLDALGVDALIEIAHRAGLDSLDAAEAYGLSLTLGGGGVRLIDLTAAYGAFAQGGDRYEPWVIARVRDQHGTVLYEHGTGTPIPVLDETTAFLVADILRDPEARIPSFGAGSVLDTPIVAGVKTGTSSEFRDNWTIGFTSDRVVGVWVGNPDQRPMVDISGVDGAAPIWRDVILAATEGRLIAAPEPPPGLVRTTVCAPTGLLPGPDCPSTAPEWFVAGREPTAIEHYYRRAGAILAIQPPVEARPWAADAGWRLASADATSDPGESASDVVVMSPAPGAVLYAAREVADDPLTLRAAVPSGTQDVTFFVDGQHAGTSTSSMPTATWPLTVGFHDVRVVARLADGTTIEAHAAYEVRER